MDQNLKDIGQSLLNSLGNLLPPTLEEVWNLEDFTPASVEVVHLTKHESFHQINENLHSLPDITADSGDIVQKAPVERPFTKTNHQQEIASAPLGLTTAKQPTREAKTQIAAKGAFQSMADALTDVFDTNTKVKSGKNKLITTEKSPEEGAIQTITQASKDETESLEEEHARTSDKKITGRKDRGKASIAGKNKSTPQDHSLESSTFTPIVYPHKEKHFVKEGDQEFNEHSPSSSDQQSSDKQAKNTHPIVEPASFSGALTPQNNKQNKEQAPAGSYSKPKQKETGKKDPSVRNNDSLEEMTFHQIVEEDEKLAESNNSNDRLFLWQEFENFIRSQNPEKLMALVNSITEGKDMLTTQQKNSGHDLPDNRENFLQEKTEERPEYSSNDRKANSPGSSTSPFSENEEIVAAKEKGTVFQPMEPLKTAERNADYKKAKLLKRAYSRFYGE